MGKNTEAQARIAELEAILRICQVEAQGILNYSSNHADRNCAAVIEFHCARGLKDPGNKGE